MTKIYNILSIVLLSITFAVLTPACSDVLESAPEDILTEDQFYRDKFDADAAIRGIYGKLVDLGPRYVILNELRADLMDVTRNSDNYLRELTEHDVSPENPWADPFPFYSLINDCNDAIYNFNRMFDESKLEVEAYEQRISDITALRSWLYYQLVIHYGEVPYIDEPIESLEDMEDLGSYPKLGIGAMISQLLTDLTQIPDIGVYTDESLIRNIDGFNTRTMFIDRQYLIGELLLWQGDYVQAAAFFKNLMERNEEFNQYDRYKLAYRDDSQPENPTTSKYNSGYLRYFGEDLNSIVNYWPLMFEEYGTSNFYYEWLWVMYYHEDYEPSPFYDYFSSQHGDYVLKPSDKIIAEWESQLQRNGFRGDFRGYMPDEYLNTGSYDMIGGDPVITKFISDFDELNALKKPGKWFLWRAAGMHLRYCEAANRAGEHFLSWSLLNNGVRANYPGLEYHEARDYTYRDIAYETDDVGNIVYDMEIDPETNDTSYIMYPLEFPFDFDARQTNAYQIPPNARGEWHRNIGVRGRVGLANLPLEEENIEQTLENDIIDEAGRELAFEGQRWADLVRIALRRGDNAFLADKIAKKFEDAGNPGKAEEIRTKLMDKENWFLPME